MIRSAIKYGVFAGVLVLCYTSLLIRSGLIYLEGIGPYLGYLAIVIMPFFTFLAIKEVSAVVYRNQISLKNALTTGLIISVVAACAYSGLQWVEYAVFSNVYEETLIDKTRVTMLETGATELEIDKRLAAIREHYHSWMPFRNTLIWYIGLGILYSLASFLILKYIRNPKTI